MALQGMSRLGLQGAQGAYASGSHRTGFTGIMGASSMSAQNLAGWLNGSNNPKHDFSMFLGDDQITMLVAFMKGGLVNTASFINSDKTVIGDVGNGKTLFEGSCTSCHGTDGKQINFGEKNDPAYISSVALSNPWEFFHKGSFGQPGKNMPSGVNLGMSVQDRIDVISHAQTLPTE